MNRCTILRPWGSRWKRGWRRSRRGLLRRRDLSMNRTSTRVVRLVGPAACALLLAVAVSDGRPPLAAQASSTPAKVPDLAGIWDGSQRARPINSETAPWGKDNFPVLNERALAHQKVFDEALSPKYDCTPSTPPAIEYDPYMM